MHRNICSTPFFLTHQFRNSVFNANRSQLRGYATSNLGFSSQPNAAFQNLRIRTNAKVLPGKNSARLLGTATIGLTGLSYYASRQEIHCDAPSTSYPPHGASPANVEVAPLPPPPRSSVNAYELTFGTVCGICAGVFVKKGAKALAFVFGGVFVLLQYFGSLNLVRVDWGRMSTRFESLFYTRDAQGVKHAPNIGSLARWIVDFLTANFQQRASFVAGFALGIRIG